MRWDLAEGQDAFLAGDVYPDGSCSIAASARAGWTVGEVGRDFHGRLRKGRRVSGTLPGHVQSAEGAELYSLLQWLRHLDPTSRVRPRFHTDSQRIADGWCRVWDTRAPWVPHRDLWIAVELLRDDVRDDVQVIWIPSHQSLQGMAGRGPVAAARAYGNAWADAQAKIAATWHGVPEATLLARARTAALAYKLGTYYAIFLEWALDQPDGLPEATPLEVLFRLPRPPPLPVHCFAADAGGSERCIRCLMPPGLCAGRPCRPQGSLGHKLMRIGHGIFCRTCGLYSFQELNMLKSHCRGPPPRAGGNAHRLLKLLAGVHPRSGHEYGKPQAIEPDLETFSVILGDDGLEEEHARVRPPGASLASCPFVRPRASDEVRFEASSSQVHA